MFSLEELLNNLFFFHCFVAIYQQNIIKKQVRFQETNRNLIARNLLEHSQGSAGTFPGILWNIPLNL